jgi:hypothetical protein
MIAAAVAMASAPSHGADYGSVVWVVPITIVVSVVVRAGLLVWRRGLAS